MFPATKSLGGQKVWTREQTEQALRDYITLYGDAITATCFSPSSAKWGDRQDLIDRYYAGNSLRGGCAWPSLNTIKTHYGGSFNTAREALGLPANTPGPSRSRRGAGLHGPVRDVRERVQTRYIERDARPAPSNGNGKPPKTRVERVIERVQAPDDKRLRKQATRAEQRLAKSVESLRAARGRLRDADAKARAAVRVSEGLRKRLSAVEARLKDAEGQTPALRDALKVLERDRDRDLEAFAHAAETAREAAETAEAELTVARARVDELEAALELSDPAEMARARGEVESARGQVADAVAKQHEAERVTGDAARERRIAEKRAEKAEKSARVSEAERVRVQAAITGHTKPLTMKQVDELRSKGPGGSMILMAAMKRVVLASSKGERETLRDALREVASAAIGWGDRL
jgi:predicted  nucleic acid-binding Zn-ribbon protein